MDERIAEEVGKSGMDKTEFMEWAAVRALLVRGRITAKEIKDMVSNDRIKESTLIRLQREGLVK